MKEPLNALRDSWMRGLDEDARRWMFSLAEKRRVPKGRHIFDEGEPATRMYLVEEGLVKIFRITPEGKEQVIHFIRPGESFAEAALFEDRRYPASAVALSACTLYALTRGALIEGIARHPEMAVAIFSSLSRLVRQLVTQVQQRSGDPADLRLGRFLLAELGRLPRGARVINLEMKKADLAAYLALTPETLSRTLAQFARQGLIKVRGRAIRILDLDAMRERYA
jgi:CRP/FNR family transcriptional regulator